MDNNIEHELNLMPLMMFRKIEFRVLKIANKIIIIIYF